MNKLRIVIEPNEAGIFRKWQWTLEEFDETADKRKDWGKWLPAWDWSRTWTFSGFARSKEAARNRAESAKQEYCTQRQTKADRERTHEEQTEIIEVSCISS